MNLYHYYDSSVGPFVSLSDIPIDEAKKVMNEIKTLKSGAQCAKRHDNYMEDRHYYENIIRDLFIKKTS